MISPSSGKEGGPHDKEAVFEDKRNDDDSSRTVADDWHMNAGGLGGDCLR